MTYSKGKTGRSGEDLAVSFLKDQNCRILERNYKTKLGEIDIIAKDKDTICFVEVKTRTSLEFGSPFEAVTSLKQTKLARVALSYLSDHRLHDVPARFDVIAVTLTNEGKAEVEIIKNAFEIV